MKTKYTLTKEELIDLITFSHTNNSYPPDDVVTEWLSRQHDQNVEENKMKKKYKEGDKIRIIDEIHGHQFKIGEIVTISFVDTVCLSSLRYEANDLYWLSEEEIELVK